MDGKFRRLFGKDGPIGRGVEWLNRNNAAYYALGAAALLRGAWELLVRLWYELRGPYTWDTTLYWAVGRGILNGLHPYKDLFETKPPGIFYLSSLSFLTTGDVWLTHLAQVLVILAIAAVPVLYLSLKRGKIRPLHLGLAAMLGLLIALYSAERSGEVQVESFGAAFLGLYALTQALCGADDARPFRLKFWLSALFLLMAIGMKEPFLFVALAVSLFFSAGLKDWLNRFAYPLALAAAAGLLLLLVTGNLVPYFRDYLGFMTGPHVGRFGSPFVRGMYFLMPFNNLNAFTLGMGFLVLALFLVYGYNRFSGLKFLSVKSALTAAGLMGAVYLTVLAVGSGGEFYNHHFVFAVPAYLALFLRVLDDLRPVDSNGAAGMRPSIAYFIVFFMAAVPLIYLPPVNYEERLKAIKEQEKTARQEAAYTDAVMDKKGLEWYLFLGANGHQLYGFTRHSPLGPLFFQYKDWLAPGNERFRQGVVDAMKMADLVVVDPLSIQLEDLQSGVMMYLQDHFTQTPWAETAPVRKDAKKYTYYFRKEKPSMTDIRQSVWRR